ncbi:MAG: D-alanyl-D-alanine carboxypeptidase family protein [Angelakisella sp.]
MKGFLGLFAAVLLALGSTVAASAQATVPGALEFVDAAAAIVVEASTGKVLFSKNAHRALPMASTTKILTALLTLEQPALDAPFIADSDALRVEGSSMGLTAGDTVTLRALAGGMLTASGNDAANAAALRIAGSLPDFAALMNQRAAELGLRNSHFVTPSGLDDKEHYSTAADLATLTAAALQNPLFAQMCAAKKLTLYFGNPPFDRTLYNHNRLLSLYPYAIGVKTGFTKSSGRCLVSAARKDGVTLVAVTLRCGDDWRVHQALYEHYFPTVTLRVLSPPAGMLLPVVGGVARQVTLVQSGNPITAVEVSGTPLRVKSEVFAPNFVYAPIKKGDILGKIVYYIDDTLYAEAPLYAQEGIAPELPPKSGWWRRLPDKIKEWMKI